MFSSRTVTGAAAARSGPKLISSTAPVASAQTVSANFNVPVSVMLGATDADGDPLVYSIVTQPAQGTLTGTAPNLMYTPAAAFVGADSFTFKANDGALDSNVATVTINVTDTAPSLSSVSGTPTVLVEGQSVSFTASGSDTFGDPITYLWNFGDGTTSTDPNPDHVYATAGSYTATVTVS